MFYESSIYVYIIVCRVLSCFAYTYANIIVLYFSVFNVLFICITIVKSIELLGILGL